MSQENRTVFQVTVLYRDGYDRYEMTIDQCLLYFGARLWSYLMAGRFKNLYQIEQIGGDTCHAR